MILLAMISCRSGPAGRTSYWEAQKEAFKYRDKRAFVADSILEQDMKTLRLVSHPVFRNIGTGAAYLYSWQNRDAAINEFAVIRDDRKFEHGLKIYYLTLSKDGRLISATHIANRGEEGGYSFETTSRFINRDTMLQASSITEWYDPEKDRPREPPIGDTTFSWIVIDSAGRVQEHVFRKARALHYAED
jgi:hypothetical protein